MVSCVVYSMAVKWWWASVLHRLHTHITQRHQRGDDRVQGAAGGEEEADGAHQRSLHGDGIELCVRWWMEGMDKVYKSSRTRFPTHYIPFIDRILGRRRKKKKILSL